MIGKDVRLFGCKGWIADADGTDRVVVKELEDYVVAVKDGNVLVCPLADAQMVAEYSAPKL